MNDKKILSFQETCEYLGLGVTTVRKLMKRKEHPLPVVRAGKRILVPIGRLEKWLDEEAEEIAS